MSDVSSIYIYNGVDDVPMDVTHVRVDPSVTVIAEQAFQERQNLEVVELPEGLIRIGEYAFKGCKSLKRINIPSTVKKIGERAFIHCQKLDGIILPDGLEQLDERAFQYCKSLQRVNIPPGITKIKVGGFLFCDGLTNVMFSEGIIELENAFGFCESLESVSLPSTLKVIGQETFLCCNRLNEVHMPDSIESIGKRAFLGCNIISFRIPPLIVNVDMGMFGTLNGNNNKCLISLELSVNVTQITVDGDYTKQPRLESLRNVAFPSECKVATTADEFFDNRTDLRVAFALHNCTDLRAAFPNNDVHYIHISQALQHRFDDLPIHKLCYYQSYSDNETTMQSLRREINPWTSKFPGQLNTTGKEKDCLGMTPVHILACSTKPTIEMYRLLIEKYPETLIMKDKWGDIPLLYAIWCNASAEVVDLLVESYKSNHPDYEFDWKGMIQTMAKRNVPLAIIQRLINTQRRSFPDQEYDIQTVVLELAVCDTEQWAFKNGKYTRIETFKYLFQVSITKRLDSLGIRRWREELEDGISTLPEKVGNRDRDTQAVYERLATYESIKEGTSVLELAVWKAEIDKGRNKRQRVEGEDSYKEQCRVNCGADVIIRNVLPYLLPKK